MLFSSAFLRAAKPDARRTESVLSSVTPHHDVDKLPAELSDLLVG
jgi:hypothetical protein